MIRGLFNVIDFWWYEWGGDLVVFGLLFLGIWSGFFVMLVVIGILVVDVFVFGLFWFLIVVVLVMFVVIGVKILFEGFVKVRLVKEDRFVYFCSYWVGFFGYVLLWILVIGFFMFMILVIF